MAEWYACDCGARYHRQDIAEQYCGGRGALLTDGGTESTTRPATSELDEMPPRYTTMRSDGDRIIYDEENADAWVCSDAWLATEECR